MIYSRDRLEGREPALPGPSFVPGFVHYWDALLERYPNTMGAFRLLSDHARGCIKIHTGPSYGMYSMTADWAISDKRAVRLARAKLRKDREG